jgi:hypothetical protein
MKTLPLSVGVPLRVQIGLNESGMLASRTGPGLLFLIPTPTFLIGIPRD